MSDNDVAGGRVVAVLLADGWHRIVPGSFRVGPLSFGAKQALARPVSASRRLTPAVRISPPCWLARWTASSRSGRSARPYSPSATWTGPGPCTTVSGRIKAHDC